MAIKQEVCKVKPAQASQEVAEVAEVAEAPVDSADKETVAAPTTQGMNAHDASAVRFKFLMAHNGFATKAGNLDFKKLEKVTGIKSSYLETYATGKNRPKRTTFVNALCEAFNVGSAYLKRGEDAPIFYMSQETAKAFVMDNAKPVQLMRDDLTMAEVISFLRKTPAFIKNADFILMPNCIYSRGIFYQGLVEAVYDGVAHTLISPRRASACATEIQNFMKEFKEEKKIEEVEMA